MLSLVELRTLTGYFGLPFSRYYSLTVLQTFIDYILEPCYDEFMRGLIVPGIDIPVNAREGYNTGFCNAPKLPKRGDRGAINRNDMPQWFTNHEKVLKFLNRRFPKAFRKRNPDSNQKDRFERWYAVIHDWFLLGWSEGKILRLYPRLFKSRRQISRQAQMIRFAVNGLRLDGRKHTGRKRGRPSKERRRLIRASLRNI